MKRKGDATMKHTNSGKPAAAGGEKTPLAGANPSVARGMWGEDIAAEWLRTRGYAIVERNVRPSRRDARLEIDIVAYERAHDTIVFVEVKQHARRTEYDRLLRSVNARKRNLMRRACRAWLRTNKWGGAYRFDVIEVYGEPDSRRRVEIDHVERVRLFSQPSGFVNWND